MDAALAASIAEIMKLGFAGAIIIAQFVVIVVLYKSKEKQAEDRLSDTRKCTEALVTAAAAMNKSAEAGEGIQTALTNLVAELQARRGR